MGSSWRSIRCVAPAAGARTSMGASSPPRTRPATLTRAGDAQLLDPVLLDFSDQRRAQKARFGGELFPAEVPADLAGTRFLDYFQQDKATGASKGIVALDLRISRDH
jgi:uncharacterized protein DUF6932